METGNLISKDIDHFYSGTSEEKRLTLGLGPLEFERNKDLISRYLTKKKCVIIDVGGGPGVYAEWLSGLGHSVHLIDPVKKHIDQAKKRSKKLRTSFEAIPGEARQLPFPDQYADLVILHGPLYHLQQKEDRMKAIKEANRVLKSNGVALGFAINYAISTVTGLLNGMIHNDRFYVMCKNEFITGLHLPIDDMPGMLPEAYFHRPQELKDEMTVSGFTDLKLFAVEGMIWLDSKYFETRSVPGKKEAMMELLRMTEEDPNLLAFSPHIMIAGVKP